MIVFVWNKVPKNNSNKKQYVRKIINHVEGGKWKLYASDDFWHMAKNIKT